jgi:hypothetical protein
MPRVGFEPTIPVFEKSEKFRAMDRAIAVIAILKLRKETVLLHFKKVNYLKLQLNLSNPD